MRDTRVPVVRPYRLPTPQVSKAIVQQPVNLRPAGNTVAVTTLADNPFEGPKRVTVVTQASGGMAKPDRMMQSRRLMHTHLADLGEGPTPVGVPAQPAGALDFISSSINTAASLVSARQQAQIAAANAAAAQAQAQAAQAQSAGAAFWAGMQNPGAAMAKRSSITVPLLVVAGLASVGALVLFLRRKKG